MGVPCFSTTSFPSCSFLYTPPCARYRHCQTQLPPADVTCAAGIADLQCMIENYDRGLRDSKPEDLACRPE